MPSLAVENLVKKFGRVRALRGVSFALDQGEVLGYLGPNGAGKTTTLRIILGLVHATSGTVRLLNGGPGDAAVRNSVGYLAGELRLYGNMTGEALLDYFAGFRPQRPPILRERLLRALDLNSDILGRRVKLLSHGTKQKIGIVIAMQHDPELLLLDEPTTGLDPLVQKAFRGLLQDRAAAGRSVFLSSHVLSEVESVCHRVAILREGELVAVESIENLRSLMMRRLQVRFRGQAPSDLGSVPGVKRMEARGADVALWIQGDVNPILRRIAQADVEHFVFPEPELEDIFLTYYRREG